MSQPENAIRDFFRDPNVAKSVIDMVVRKKPIGWSRRSNAPYYKRCHALELKSVVDEMLTTREDQVYFYKDYPNMSANTLYLRVNQSLRFLLDFLDTDEAQYAKWSEMVNITKERGTGVRISFDDEFRNSAVSTFKPHAITSKGNTPTWKQDVDDYLENIKRVQPLHIPGLCLSPDEMTTLRDSLRPLKGIIFYITSAEIKILKVND